MSATQGLQNALTEPARRAFGAEGAKVEVTITQMTVTIEPPDNVGMLTITATGTPAECNAKLKEQLAAAAAQTAAKRRATYEAEEQARSAEFAASLGELSSALPG